MLRIRGTKKKFDGPMSPGEQLFFHLAWAYKGVQKVVVAKHTLKSPQGHSSFLAREGAFWPRLSHERGTPWCTPRGSLHALPGNHRAGKKSSAHPTNLRLIYARRLLRHKCRSLHKDISLGPTADTLLLGVSI